MLLHFKSINWIYFVEGIYQRDSCLGVSSAEIHLEGYSGKEGKQE